MIYPYIYNIHIFIYIYICSHRDWIDWIKKLVPILAVIISLFSFFTNCQVRFKNKFCPLFGEFPKFHLVHILLIFSHWDCHFGVITPPIYSNPLTNHHFPSFSIIFNHFPIFSPSLSIVIPEVKCYICAMVKRPYSCHGKSWHIIGIWYKSLWTWMADIELLILTVKLYPPTVGWWMLVNVGDISTKHSHENPLLHG